MWRRVLVVGVVPDQNVSRVNSTNSGWVQVDIRIGHENDGYDKRVVFHDVRFSPKKSLVSRPFVYRHNHENRKSYENVCTRRNVLYF